MKLTEKIVDVISGEESLVERNATPIELEQFAKAKAKAQENAQIEAEATKKRAAAEAKLAALGLTADDLKALGL